MAVYPTSALLCLHASLFAFATGACKGKESQSQNAPESVAKSTATQAVLSDGAAELLKHAPGDSQTLVYLDLRTLRGRPEWRAWVIAALGEDMLANLSRAKELCGFSPLEVIETVLLATRKSGEHVVDAKGLERSKLEACFSKMPNKAVSTEGAVTKVTDASGESSVFVWLEQSRFLFVSSPVGDPATQLKILSAQKEAALSPEIVGMMTHIELASDAWVATAKESRQGFCAELSLSDSLKVRGAIPAESTAASTDGLKSALRAQAKESGLSSLVDKLVLTRNGSFVEFAAELTQADIALLSKTFLTGKNTE